MPFVDNSTLSVSMAVQPLLETVTTNMWAGQIFPVKACKNSDGHSMQSVLSKRKAHVYLQTNYGKKYEI